MVFCNRCDWTGTVTEAETHARESGHIRCVVCQHRSLRADEKQTCLHCLSQTRRNLRSIGDLYALLPPVVHAAYPADTRFGEPRGSETPLLGGAALVLAGDGTSGSVTSARGNWRYSPETGTWEWTEGDRSHAADQMEADPPAVLPTLASWEDDWREVRGDPPGPKATITRVTDYLIRHCGWAADEHPGFDEFAHEVHRLVRTLESVMSLGEPRDFSEVRCLDDGCDGKLVQDYFCTGRYEDCKARGCGWNDGRREHHHGRSDYWRCPRCNRFYDQKSYMLALHEQLAERAS